jgi:hypothetical protein
MVKNGTNPTVSFTKQNQSRKESLNINIQDLQIFLNDVTSREKRIVNELANHDIHIIYYEELIERSSRITELLTFLGVENTNLSSQTKKLTKNPYELVINLDEVRAFFLGSEFSERAFLTDEKR